MTKDLRSFLQDYERDHPEDVVRINDPISLKFEIGVLIDKLERLRKSPLLIFENPVTVKRGPSKYKAVTDILGSRGRLAYAIDSTYEKVGLDTVRMATSERREPVVINPREAPVKEVIKKGDEIDLFELPAYQPYYMVAGPYISLGVYILYDPDTGIDNSAIARGMIQDKRQVGVFLSPGGHNHINLWKYHHERKEDAKCAIAVGFHPAAYMGMGVRLKYPQSHYGAAGALLREPMRLVPSETLGDDFLVPADAEVVIEGIIPRNERAPEGPYSEYTRHIGCQRWRPFLKVNCVTHRKDLIWPNYAIGRNHCFQGLTREARVYNVVKESVPQVQDVYLLPHAGGNDGLGLCFIRMKQTANGQARAAIYAALNADYGIKHVIAVDNDVDIYDERYVFWAVGNRSQPSEDWVIIKDVMASIVDPSLPDHVGSKGGIDATLPVGEAFEIPTVFPKEVMENVKLSRYIPSEKLDKIPDAFTRQVKID